MALTFPITFSLAPFTTGASLDANSYGQALVANLQATISGNFLTGQIGGLQPTQNVGPWLNNEQWWFWDAPTATYVQQSLTSSFPSGSIIMYGGTSAPTGFLLCDGSLYLRSTYSALFAVIGGTYNNGDGSSTFGVPDMRGRVPVCSGTGSGLTARSIGQSFGEENHVLTVAQLATHSHVLNDPGHNHTHSDPGHAHGISDPTHNHGHSDPGHAHGITDPGHTHTYVYPLGNFAGTAGSNQYSPQSTTATGSSTTGISINAATTGISNNASGTGISINSAATGVTNNAAVTGMSMQNTGSGSGHNNMQPSLVHNYIIKT